MPGKLVPVVMVPRFTTFAGGGGYPFHTVAVDVSEYQKAVLTVWRGPIQASAGAFVLTCQESTDRETWTECNGSQTMVSPSAGQQVICRPTLGKRWFRVEVNIASGLEHARVTCWAVGHLERREE